MLILTPNSRISQVFAELIASADMVFVAGLPGVGKSLMLQQLTLMAQQAGREVDLLQWDTVRVVFERPIYPVIAGVTHPMVITGDQSVAARSPGRVAARQCRASGRAPNAGRRTCRL